MFPATVGINMFLDEKHQLLSLKKFFNGIGFWNAAVRSWVILLSMPVWANKIASTGTNSLDPFVVKCVPVVMTCINGE